MNTTTTTEPKNKPAHEVRIGCIKAVIWANKPSNNMVFHSVVLVRIYRDDNGVWHETHSLGRDDLLLAAKVLDQAHTWVCDAERK